ncbi:MAG: hypothetical protein IKB86_04985 [Clostridia bacterium]|nr:hypothetical protein [Clostridia bacterium]
MKKALSCLCAILILFTCFCLTGCYECEHEYGVWENVNGEVSNCTDEKQLQRICTKCGNVDFSTEAGKPHEEVRSVAEKNRGVFEETVKCKNCSWSKITSDVSVGSGITLDETSPKDTYVFAYTFEERGNYTCIVDAAGDESVKLRLSLCPDNSCESWFGSMDGNGKLELPSYFNTGTVYFLLEITNPNGTAASVTFEIFASEE